MMMNPELASCAICPQNCGVNRYEKLGFCRAGSEIKINLAQLHHGEEPVLSGTGGSGTIFLAHCNLRCRFCQNHEISHLGWGRYYTREECAKLILELQKAGAHNINFVSPTHFSLQLAEVIKDAKAAGLTIPVVWNSNAYEKVETLGRLEGLVDIYLPDYKYAHNAYSQKYSQAKDYPRVALEAIHEMQRQVGELRLDSQGIAQRGLLIRHLVLPNGISGTRKALYELREKLGAKIAVSLMSQYYPTPQAAEHQELSRGISLEEYQDALAAARELEINLIFTQELSPSSDWTPQFTERGSKLEGKNLHFRGKHIHAKV